MALQVHAPHYLLQESSKALRYKRLLNNAKSAAGPQTKSNGGADEAWIITALVFTGPIFVGKTILKSEKQISC